MFLSNATDVTECRLTLIGQVQFIGAPIIHPIPPLHKSALLQLIDNCHQAARVHMKHLSQSLLAQSSGFAQHPENAGMRWRKTQRRKPLREFASSVRPYLGEQE